MAIFTCLIVSLWFFVKQDISIEKVNVKVAQTKKVQLPKLLTDKFQYQKSLANPNNDRFSAQYETPKESVYKVRCGSFKTASKAHVLTNKLKPVITMNVIEDKGWFVVVSNKLKNKRTAEAIKHTIVSNIGVYDCFLQKTMNQ